MNLLGLLLTFAVALTEIGAATNNCICSRNHVPVCGSDDVTYNNECIANCNNATIACKGKCPCTQEDTRAEVEESNNDADAAVVEYDCDVGCPKHLNYVCGTDGKTYQNPCLAACDGKTTLQCRGFCPCPETIESRLKPESSKEASQQMRCGIGCTRLYQPVCGQDGKFYNNECFARCDGETEVACKGECPCQE